LKWAKEISAKAIVIPLMEGSTINNPIKENIFLDSMHQIKSDNNDVKILLETDLSNHLRVKNLNIAACRLVVAGKKGTKLINNMKVATKYPSITKKYFQSKGFPCSVLKLYGSIELASVLGMSDVIVDLVESGQTLKQNGLVEIETIENISSVLIVNKTSYKINREQINKFFKKLNLDKE
jgi:ATP phosphoribosyltransferase